MSDAFHSSQELSRCRTCGTVLNGSRFDGLCPACTWRGLSAEEPEEEFQIPSRKSQIPNPKSATDSKALFRFPGYVVLEEIARGGMGIVYRARQLDPEREVAIKMLLPHQMSSLEMAERFRLEVRALTGLDHPSILPVYQTVGQDGLP